MDSYNLCCSIDNILLFYGLCIFFLNANMRSINSCSTASRDAETDMKTYAINKFMFADDCPLDVDIVIILS